MTVPPMGLRAPAPHAGAGTHITRQWRTFRRVAAARAANGRGNLQVVEFGAARWNRNHRTTPHPFTRYGRASELPAIVREPAAGRKVPDDRCRHLRRKSTEQTGADADAKSVARQIENARAFALAKGWTVRRRARLRRRRRSAAPRRVKLVNRQRLLDAIAAAAAVPSAGHARRLALQPPRRRRGLRRIEAHRAGGRRDLVLPGRHARSRSAPSATTSSASCAPR